MPGFGIPYSGHYQVLSRREKTLQLLLRGRLTTTSTAMVKPAYILNETGRGTTIFNSAVDATLAAAPPAAPPQPVTRTTRYEPSERRVRFPAGFNS
jgi:hypothetical protein